MSAWEQDRKNEIARYMKRIARAEEQRQQHHISGNTYKELECINTIAQAETNIRYVERQLSEKVGWL